MTDIHGVGRGPHDHAMVDMVDPSSIGVRQTSGIDQGNIIYPTHPPQYPPGYAPPGGRVYPSQPDVRYSEVKQPTPNVVEHINALAEAAEELNRAIDVLSKHLDPVSQLVERVEEMKIPPMDANCKMGSEIARITYLVLAATRRLYAIDQGLDF
jgi:hypothetical protein